MILLANSQDLAFPKTTHLAGLGAAGVHVFFVISGFIMVWTNRPAAGRPDGQNWQIFLLHRFFRIFPSYWLLIIASAAIRILIDRDLPTSPAEIAATALLLPSAASNLIFVGWTLSFELYFYLIFAVSLTMGLSSRGRVMVLSVFFTLSVAIGAMMHPHPQTVFGLARLAGDSLLLEFVAGAWIALIFSRPSPPPLWLGWSAVAVGVATFAISVLVGYERFPTVLIWGVPSTLLVFGAVCLERHGVGLSLFRKLTPLGESSYALYLVHAVLLQAMVWALSKAAPLGYGSFLFVSLCLFLICLGTAHLYYLTAERGLARISNAMIRRWSPRRP